MRGHLLLLAGAIVALTGCETPVVRPFAPVGVLDDAGTIAVLRSRTAPVRSAYALLSMAFDSPERSGTLDAVVQWRAPGALRVTAFKDLLIASRDVFDLLLGERDYAVELPGEDEEPIRDQGPLQDFPRAHPRFSAFYWVGEGLLLAGAVGDGGQVLERSEEAVRVGARLHSGAAVTWSLEPRTLTPLEGVVRAPGGRTFTVRYQAWRRVGRCVLPEQVVLDDPQGGLHAEMVADELEVNAELGPEAFDPATVGTGDE